MKHSEYIAIAQGLGAQVLQKSIIGGIAKAVPFFALGLPNTLLIKFATWLATIIAEQAEMMIFFKYVDFRSDAQAKDFEAAMLNNHKAQIEGTNEEKNNAEKALMEALARLVNLKS